MVLLMPMVELAVSCRQTVDLVGQDEEEVVLVNGYCSVVEIYAWMSRSDWLAALMTEVFFARVVIPLYETSVMAASTAMITMTISNSTIVKPLDG